MFIYLSKCLVMKFEKEYIISIKHHFKNIIAKTSLLNVFNYKIPMHFWSNIFLIKKYIKDVYM